MSRAHDLGFRVQGRGKGGGIYHKVLFYHIALHLAFLPLPFRVEAHDLPQPHPTATCHLMGREQGRGGGGGVLTVVSPSLNPKYSNMGCAI